MRWGALNLVISEEGKEKAREGREDGQVGFGINTPPQFRKKQMDD